MQEKIKRKEQLEAFVKSKEAELEQLRREVSNGRMHIQNLNSVLDTQVNKLLSVYMREKQYQAELQSHLDQLTKEVQWNIVDLRNIPVFSSLLMVTAEFNLYDKVTALHYSRIVSGWAVVVPPHAQKN